MATSQSKPLRVSILSPERKIQSEQETTEITLTGSEGRIQILPGHANMIGTVETGLFGYKTAGSEVKGFISTGFFEVVDNHVSIMGDVVELKEEIDVDRAKTAEGKARDLLKSGTLEPDSFKKHQLKLQRAIIRQQVVGR